MSVLRDSQLKHDESADEPNFLNEPSMDEVTPESFLKKQE